MIGGPSTSRGSDSSTTVTSTIMNTKEKEKYIGEFSFPYCDEASKYEPIAKIGQGSFGEVFKAKEKKNPKKVVAMKKVLMDHEREGVPITALREIRILKHLKHENVVNLIEVCGTKAHPFATISEVAKYTQSSTNLKYYTFHHTLFSQIKKMEQLKVMTAFTTCLPVDFREDLLTTQLNKYRSTLYLVFDFCEHDLSGLLSNVNVKFSLGEIKKVMKQLLNGLYYIHRNKILHRDIKAANVLITKDGILKIADFGLARAFSEKKNGQANRYTNRVVTLWYRPPELLLGDRNYGTPVDLWGAGCIMAEMWTRSPIMQGKSEQQQLALISQLCGSITPDVWPGVEALDLYNKMELPRDHKRKVSERLKPYVKDPHAIDLLEKLLVLDPAKRTDADSALNHDFFWTDPMPCDLSKMLAQHTQSMFEFLAPPRRPGLMGPHHHQPGAVPSTTVSKPVSSMGSGYQDRVF